MTITIADININTTHTYTIEIDHTTTSFLVYITYSDGVIIKMLIHKWAKEGYDRPKNAL
jgi:hypothetical protein